MIYAICFYINLWSNTFKCFKVPPSHFCFVLIDFAAISILDYCLCMQWNICMVVIVAWLENGFVQSLIKSAFRQTNTPTQTHTHTHVKHIQRNPTSASYFVTPNGVDPVFVCRSLFQIWLHHHRFNNHSNSNKTSND